MSLRYKINEQFWDIKNVVENNLFFSTSQVYDKTYLFNINKNLRLINILNRANIINWRIQRAIFDKRFFICNEVLKSGVIHNLSFRFRDINFNNINDIYFAINIVIISTTLFEALIIIAFIFKLVIVIVINIDVTVVIVIIIVIIIAIALFIIVFKRFIFKLIAFDLDIKDYLVMNTSLDKSQNLTIVESFNNVFLKIDNNISLLWKKSNKTIKKTLNEKDIIELLTFKKKN